LWALYAKTFSPRSVVRLGVRYINRIELPYVDGVVDLDHVFAAGPKIPPALEQTLDSFFSRIVIPQESYGATLAIAQDLEPAVGDPPHYALLDIDAWSNTEMQPDDPGLWHQLGRLREVKNRAFFGSLHEPIWERYR
jgi:uncharacterized protein (TIGR04255 family)